MTTEQAQPQLPPLPKPKWHTFCTKCGCSDTFAERPQGARQVDPINKPNVYVDVACPNPNCGYMCIANRDDSLTPDEARAYALKAAAEREAAVRAELEPDAMRYRRLIAASEMEFPVFALADDPENDCRLLYGRKRIDAEIDRSDEIPPAYAARTAAGKEKQG